MSRVNSSRPKLGLADLDLELLDVDGRINVLLHDSLREDDRVLEVVPVPGHEADQDVPAQGQLAVEGRGPVGEDLPLLDQLAGRDHRLLVQAGPLVQADVLAELVDDVVVEDDPGGVDVGDRRVVRGLDDHPRVHRHRPLQAGRHDRRLGHQQGHGLPLHVRAHQSPVGVVVLQERDQAGRDAHHLLRRDVLILDLLGGDGVEVGLIPGDDLRPFELAVVVDRGVGGGQVRLRLFIGPHPDDLLGPEAVDDLAIRGDEEAVLVDPAVDPQGADQADVRPFRGLDRADPAVVRDVDVADLESGPLPVQAARPERREPPLVGELGEGVGLVDDLRQLAPAEEVFDRRADALGVDQAPGGDILGVLQAHPLLDGPSELEEPLAQLVGGQLVDGPEPTIAQVVDVVDLTFPLAEVEDVADRVDVVERVQDHLVVGDRLAELAVDPEPTDLAQAVAVGVEELLVEELAGLLQLGRVARPEPLVDPQQGALVVRGRVFLERLEDQQILGILEDGDDRRSWRRPGPGRRPWRSSSRSRSGPRRCSGRRRRRRRPGLRAWRPSRPCRCRCPRIRRTPGGWRRRWRTSGSWPGAGSSTRTCPTGRSGRPGCPSW